jgi:outer membrane receptor for ferrienterochelin and colicins
MQVKIKLCCTIDSSHTSPGGTSSSIIFTKTMQGMTKIQIFLLLLAVIFIFVLPPSAFAQTDSINIYDLDLTQLSELKITTVTKNAQYLREIPSTIYIITSEEIRDKGYFTIEEALSDLPGFQFRNIQGINSYVFQRGIPNQNNLTLVLIDGVQVNELNSGGFYGGGQYNLSNVERIEVIYGPASVAYGTNAVSGIINIMTKSALEEQYKLHALIGSFQTSAFDFQGCFVNEKKTFGIRLSGMVKKSDKADLKGQAGDGNWTDRMDNFENDYSFDLKLQTGGITGGMNVLYKQASTATWEKSVGTIYRDYGTSWNILFINNYVKYFSRISEKLTNSSILYNRNATVLRNTIYYVVDTAQIGYYRPNNLTGFENVLNYEMNKNISLTGGLTLEYEQLSKKNSSSSSDSPEHKPPEPAKPEMLNNHLVSFFFEPQLTFSGNLHISGGARFDRSSTYGEVLTPRAGLSYNLQNHIVRISYAEAFRAPKPWDYTDGLGNSSLLPERMKSLETSITVSLTENVKVDLATYKNKLMRAIVKDVTAEGYRWINSGEVNTVGVELNLHYNSQRLISSFNYTFDQSYNELHEFVPEISKHTANASSTYSLNRFLKINLRANYIGKRENPKIMNTTNTRTMDPYVIVHGSLSVAGYKGFNIQLAVKNIFDKEYYHTSNRVPDRYRQPQRTILISVGYALDSRTD